MRCRKSAPVPQLSDEFRRSAAISQKSFYKSAADRSKDSEPLRIACRHCKSETWFLGMADKDNPLIRSKELTCPNSHCHRPIEMPSLALQVDNQIRTVIAKFYESWLVCDNSSCEHRTRMVSIYGKRCLKDLCVGTMESEVSSSSCDVTCADRLDQYTAKDLHNQIIYFDNLFDGEDAVRRAGGTPREGMSTSSYELYRY